MTSNDTPTSGSTPSSSNRSIVVLLGLLLAIVFCCIVILGIAATIFFVGRSAPAPDANPTATVAIAIPVAPTDQPDALSPPLDTPILPSTPSADDSSPLQQRQLDTETLLRQIEAPGNDPIDLAARLRPELGQVNPIANETTPVYEVGDVIPFWVSNSETDENWQIDAELLIKGEHVYMWVEKGATVDMDDLRRAADLFDNQIYPTNREFFGTEWSPGIDNDPRLHVLHATNLGDGTAGYFSSADEIPSAINPYSNEKEMFYINLDSIVPGSTFYNGVLAHEFQHMIHWNQDMNETTWINEGASELAMQLNGLRRSEDSIKPDEVFANDPDLQLNTWPDSEESYAHYGNAYLFMNYFLSRFGEEATQALIADPANSMQSVDDVLKELDLGLSADDLFADWVIANWLDDPDLLDGRWGYPDYDPKPMTEADHLKRLPVDKSGEVHQYGADYITIDTEGDVTITFEGDTTTRLAPTQAYSGDWAWWSNRVDSSDTRLTLPVDLSDVDEATLRFRTWYDIEELWDYAYLEVSDDGGATWELLETKRTTDEDPYGNAYGPGYSGQSGTLGPKWVLEEVDLSPYAGQPIQIRFEYVTDLAVTQPGMFIDDVEIPEIGYFESFEQGPGDWQSEGWLLTDNMLTQRWIVQVIETDEQDNVQVFRMPVGADGRGSLRLEDVSDRNDLVLVISGLAPLTVEQASYRYSISND